MTARRLHIAFVSAAVVWAVLIVVAPFLASRAHASTFGAALTLAVYAIGSAVCHQLPERSFHLWAAQMPVCARCTGIYSGAALTALAAGAARLKPCPTYDTTADTRAAENAYVGHRFSGAIRGAVGVRPMLALAVLPSLATLVVEWTTGATPANWIRFAAGVPLGVAVAWLVRTAAKDQVN